MPDHEAGVLPEPLATGGQAPERKRFPELRRADQTGACQRGAAERDIIARQNDSLARESGREMRCVFVQESSPVDQVPGGYTVHDSTDRRIPIP